MINRALRLLRNYHSLKQKDLAQRLDISPSHLSEIESGLKPVSYELLESYARVFDIPVSSIAMFLEASKMTKRQRLQANINDKVLRLLEWMETVTRISEDDERTKQSLPAH